MSELMRGYLGYFVIGMCVLLALVMGGPIIISDWLRDRRAHKNGDSRSTAQSLGWLRLGLEAVFSQSDGGSERTIDANAFPAYYLRLINPMDAAFATADLTLPRIQLICDPESPAETGTAYLD